MAWPSSRASTPSPTTIIGFSALRSASAISLSFLNRPFKRVWSGTEMLIVISQVRGFADDADFQIIPQPGLADAGIPDRRFLARIGADQQQRVSLFNA